jgi:hypothetical protein
VNVKAAYWTLFSLAQMQYEKHNSLDVVPLLTPTWDSPMPLLQKSIKWIMLVAGLLTCTMFYAVIAPEAVLRSNFGQSMEGPLAQIVVRNWGALIGMMGLLLIYGAFHEPTRRIALLFAGASKIVFITLVVSLGQQFLQFQIGVSIVVDTVMVLIFAAYLIGDRFSSSGR